MNRFGQWFTRLALRAFTRPVPPVAGLRDLPLVEVAARGPASDTLAVFLSGDGGWAKIDRAISRGIARRGIPVAGFNALKYFLKPRTPEAAAADLARVIEHYLGVWEKERLLLIGYSRGANVLPFLIARLPERLRARVRLTVLLSPGRAEEFEVCLRDWFEDLTEHLHHWGMVDDHFDLPDAVKAAPPDGARPVLPELERLRGGRILCFYGEKERQSLGPLLDPALARTIRLPGGHHFDRNYAAIARRILEVLDEG